MESQISVIGGVEKKEKNKDREESVLGSFSFLIWFWGQGQPYHNGMVYG